MELPRHRSRALPQQATISPQAAAAGAGAVGFAVADALSQISRTTAALTEAASDSRARLAEAEQQSRVRAFLKDERWNQAYLETDRGPVLSSEVMAQEWEDLQAELSSADPRLRTRGSQERFGIAQRNLLSAAQVEVEGFQRRQLVAEAKANTVTTANLQIRDGLYEDAIQTIRAGHESGLFGPGEADQIIAQIEKTAVQQSYNDEIGASLDLDWLGDLGDSPVDNPQRMAAYEAEIERLEQRAIEAMSDTRLSAAEQRTMANALRATANMHAVSLAEGLRQLERQGLMELKALRARVTAQRDRMALGLTGRDFPEDLSSLGMEIAGLDDSVEGKYDLLGELEVMNALSNIPAGDGSRISFNRMTPAQRQQFIRGIESTIAGGGEVSPFEMAVLDLAKRIDSVMTTRMNDDPAGTIISTATMEPPPLADTPREQAAALSQWGAQASHYAGVPISGYTAEQLTGLNQTLESLDPVERGQLLSELIAGGGEAWTRTVLAEIGERHDGMMAMGGVLYMEDPVAGQMVWKGMDMLRNDPSLWNASEFQQTLEDELGTAYGLGTEVRGYAEQAIRADYVASASLAGLDASDIRTGSTRNRRKLRESIDRVTGGLVEFGGRQYPAPFRGVTEREFGDWLETRMRDGESLKVSESLSHTDVSIRLRRGDYWLVPTNQPGEYAIGGLGLYGEGRVLRREDGTDFTIQYEAVPPILPPVSFDRGQIPGID